MSALAAYPSTYSTVRPVGDAGFGFTVSVTLADLEAEAVIVLPAMFDITDGTPSAFTASMPKLCTPAPRPVKAREAVAPPDTGVISAPDMSVDPTRR
jgi:hypothetical protein